MKTIAWVLLVLASALGCGRRPSQRPPSTDASDQSEPQVQPSPLEPRRVELMQGKPVDLGGGTSVELKSVMYAHLSGSRNSSLLTMDVTRGVQHEQVTLDRLDPVGAEGPRYRLVMGLRIAIDYVDAYHQPSTAAILVLPE
jgi:hypothetical protein